jgi:hypothetical protein
MMKKFVALALLMSILLSGCSANKRATWHLNRATQLNPSLLKERVIVKVDTVVTKEIAYADTVSFSGVDSVVVSNDTVVTTLIKYEDRIIVKTKVKPYNIVRDVKVKVPVVEYVPNPKTWVDKAKDVLLLSLFVILLFILATRFVTRWLR